jgi:hypothetical protein
MSEGIIHIDGTEGIHKNFDGIEEIYSKKIKLLRA